MSMSVKKQATKYTVDVVVVMNPPACLDVTLYMDEWFGRFSRVEPYRDEESDFFQHTISNKCDDPIKMLKFLESVVIDYPECAIARVVID